MKRLVSLMLIFSIILPAFAVFTPISARAYDPTLNLMPTDDTYTWGQESSIHGLEPSIIFTSYTQIGQGTNEEFFKFDLSSLPDGVIIQSARLYLYAYWSLGPPYTGSMTWFWATTNNWSETTLNWFNKPPFGLLLGQLYCPQSYVGWVSWGGESPLGSYQNFVDYVFQAYQGDKILSLHSSLGAEDVYSKDSPSLEYRPYLQIAYARASTSVVCSPNPVSAGSPATCTATVSGSNPTGTVTWSTSSATGSFSQSVCTLSSGSCSTMYTDTSPGTVTITASYSGDSNNVPSSGSTTLAVSAPPPSTYSVFFEETGVGNPAQVWSVTLDGYGTEYSNGPGNTIYTIVFTGVTNGGLYQFTVTSPSGFVAQPTSGTMTVNGGDVHQPVTFNPTPPPAYSATISAHCNTEGIDLAVPITEDGSATGYTTPHTFNGLSGSHTFAVPSTDASGHPFKQWSSSQTTITITVSAGGAYTAYYEAPPPFYDVYIVADDYNKQSQVSVGAIWDEQYPATYHTPFKLSLQGTHTFRVDGSQDTYGHPFWKWSTGQTSTIITVTGPGTYTAHYRALHDVALTDLKCSSDFVDLGKNIKVQISAENKGTSPETFLIDVTMNNRHNQYATLGLKPDEKNSVTVCISTNGWPSGTYSIGAKAILDSELPADWWNNEAPTHSIDLGAKSYFIILAGGYLGPGSQKDWAYYGVINVCNQAYKTLTKDLQIDPSQICYLAPETQKGTYPGLYNSIADVKWAIGTWAYDRLNKYCSLFIYINGHCSDAHEFFTNFTYDTGPYEKFFPSDLAGWLSPLKNDKHARIHVIADCCTSGSFIPALASVARATICSCRSSEDTPTWGGESFFGSTFWVAIREGKSVFDAYDCAGGTYWGEAVFDDINSGREFYGVDGWNPLVPGPNGEGKYISNLYMGKCEWAFPYISSAIPTEYHRWPPSQSVSIWAVIQNNTALSDVTVSMIPPNLVMPNENETLDLETFRMIDAKGDGNFSVQIPSINFTNHASGPSVFSFLLKATLQDGVSGYARVVNVVFTQDGQPTTDDTSPTIFITRPLNLDTVHGIVNINGTVCDDVCLQKTELYIDGNLSQSLNLPASSTSFFQFSLDTSTLSNGYHNITVNAFDTSNNCANETVDVWVLNDLHDLATVYLNLFKTVIAQGQLFTAGAVMVNQGTYAENVTLTFQVNSTIMETETMKNLPASGVVEFVFNWNTSGAAYGNYSITANVDPVPNETDTDNNAYNLVVKLSIPGDINGDFTVDIYDAITLAGAFNSGLSTPNWNSNADINGDNTVDIYDAIILANHFNENYP